MSEPDPDERDRTRRPPDPAGTQPKVEPESLVSHSTEPLSIDSDAVEVVGGNATRAEAPAPRAELVAPAMGREPVAARTAAGGAMAGAPPNEPPHAARFQFILGALIAVGVVAVALTSLVVAGNPHRAAQPAWSAWHPTASNGNDAIAQIGQHVGAEYRVRPGGQLTDVQGQPLQAQGQPIAVVLPASPAVGGGPTVSLDPGVLYIMCWPGIPKCAASPQRTTGRQQLLLRREALEVALYTFTYIGGIHQVVVLLPRSGTLPREAVYLRPEYLTQELNQPLNTYLASATPSTATIERSADAQLVKNVTNATLYTASLSHDTVGKGISVLPALFLVLEPFGSTTK